MVSRRKSTHRDRIGQPPMTPEAVENEMVSHAYDLAKQQILDGTASAQVITHFLKLGSSRERLEQQRLESENELLRSKVQQLASAQNVEQLYAEALRVMRRYQGTPEEEYEEYYDDD